MWFVKVDLWGETSDKIKANAKYETSAYALTNICLQLSKRLDPKYLNGRQGLDIQNRNRNYLYYLEKTFFSLCTKSSREGHHKKSVNV